MIENNEKIYFTNITLFTTALCNLNCGYCYIRPRKALDGGYKQASFKEQKLAL